MGETRLQAAVMCCKTFVKYLDTLFDPEPITVSAPESAPLSPAALANEAKSFPLPERPQQNGATPTPSERNSESSNANDAAARIDGIRLWSHILQVLERLIRSGGQSDGLEEAIPESLKNIVLVMSSDGYLVPPAANGEEEGRSAQQKRLWKVTFVRLERFQPGLMEGIFPGAGAMSPTEKAQPAPRASTSTKATEPQEEAAPVATDDTETETDAGKSEDV